MNPIEKLDALKYYMWEAVETISANYTIAKNIPHRMKSFNDFILPENQLAKINIGDGWNNRGKVIGVHGFLFDMDYASREWESKNVGYFEYAKEKGFKV